MIPLILISPAEPLPTEAETMHALFESGLDILHLRKPNWDKVDYENLLKAIPPQHKRKVVLHQYHELAAKYNVKGLHLREEARQMMPPEQLRQLVTDLRKTQLSFSSSFHQLEEAVANSNLYDYVFVSPVFDSISKAGHKANPALQPSAKSLSANVVALGGVDASTIPLAKYMGFQGVAVLGAVWQSKDPVQAFLALKRLWEEG